MDGPVEQGFGAKRLLGATGQPHVPAGIRELVRDHEEVAAQKARQPAELGGGLPVRIALPMLKTPARLLDLRLAGGRAGKRRHEGGGEAKRGMRVGHVRRDAGHPVAQRVEPGRQNRPHRPLHDHVRGKMPVVRGDGIPHLLCGAIVLAAPFACAAKQIALIRIRDLGLRAQNIPQQTVVAKPSLMLVHRHDEQAFAREVLDDAADLVACKGRAQDMLAEWLAHPVEMRRRHEEAPHLGRLVRKELLDEVVRHVPVLGQVRPDRAQPRRIARQRQPEPKRRGPALGGAHEVADILARKARMGVAKHLHGLVDVKLEVVHPDHGKRAARHVRRQGQGRLDAREHDRMHVGRLMPQEEARDLVDLVALGKMVVVKHENEIPVERDDVVEQRGHDAAQRRLVYIRERGVRRPILRHAHMLERVHEVAQEDVRVRIALVKGKPGIGGLGLPRGKPRLHERRLSVAGGGKHQGEREPRALGELPDEALAPHDGLHWPNYLRFCGD